MNPRFKVPEFTHLSEAYTPLLSICGKLMCTSCVVTQLQDWSERLFGRKGAVLQRPIHHVYLLPRGRIDSANPSSAISSWILVLQHSSQSLMSCFEY
jgi:hypothetical protein